MSTQQSVQRFTVGDRVKILHSIWRGRIVEFRGPLGPGGTLIYRVRIPGDPKATYVEVREDQLVALPAHVQPNASPQVATPKNETRSSKRKSKNDRKRA